MREQTAGVLLVAGALAVATVGEAKSKDEGYLSLGLSVPSFSYDIDSKPADPNAAVSTLSFAPYIPLAATVSLGMYGVSLGASYDIPGTAADTNGNGATGKTKADYTSYDFSYYLDRFGVAGSYTKLKGMNITAVTGVSASDLAAGTAAERPDIMLTSGSASVWLAPLSYNLSLKDFYDPAAPAHGSGVALLVSGSYDNLDESTDQRLIPSQYSQPFGSDADLKGGHFVSQSALVGPAVVLEVGGIYLEGLFTYGTGQQTATFISESQGQEKETRSADKTEMYVAAGYKGDHGFSMLNYMMESASYDMHSFTLSTTRDGFNWVLGLRF